MTQQLALAEVSVAVLWEGSLIAGMSTEVGIVSVGHCSLRGRLSSPHNGFRGLTVSICRMRGLLRPMFSNEIDLPSVPQGLRVLPSPAELRSDGGLLGPFELFSSLPKRQHQDCQLSGSGHCSLFESTPCSQSDSPGLQRRVPLHTADQCTGCFV